MLLYAVSVILDLLHVAHATCPQFQLPSRNDTRYWNTYLPDPFLFQNGQKVTTKADWQCRRQELLKLMEEYELGTVPSKPSVAKGSLADGKLIIDIEEDGRKTSFDATVRLPANSDAKSFPAIIAIDGLSIPIDNTSVATIVFKVEQIAKRQAQESRGRGKFYCIYGSKHSAGALAAWTWGLSRFIDALEQLGPELTRIDTKRLGIEGCSRNGRAALVMGALEDRIALTIVNEGLAGTAGPWRTYDWRKVEKHIFPEGKATVWGSTYWRKDFPSIARSFYNLPYDHHELIGVVAPRGLYIPHNDLYELESKGAGIGAAAGRMIYEALGVETNLGYSGNTSPIRCQFSSTQAG